MNIGSQDISGRYRHYKGNEYEVIATGLHTETEQRLIIYRDINQPNKVWARPLEMFVDKVTVNGREISRFEKTGD